MKIVPLKISFGDPEFRLLVQEALDGNVLTYNKGSYTVADIEWNTDTNEWVVEFNAPVVPPTEKAP